ncbi:MAG: RDD family protein [Bacteriovoracia bacterium]
MDFKPITNGLGFHPFSEGLPYSTPQKTAAPKITTPVPPMGTGAVAAGPARPAPLPSLPPLIEPRREPEKRTDVPTSRTEAPLIEAPALGFGYLAKRVAGFLIDTGLNVSICLGTLALVLLKMNLDFTSFFASDALALAMLFALAFSWALVSAQEIAFNTSIGKRIAGLGLEGTTGRIFLRSLLFALTTAVFAIGPLWAVLDRKRRTLYDLLTGTQPVEIVRLN